MHLLLRFELREFLLLLGRQDVIDLLSFGPVARTARQMAGGPVPEDSTVLGPGLRSSTLKLQPLVRPVIVATARRRMRSAAS